MGKNKTQIHTDVIPAKAGIQKRELMDARFRGHDRGLWIAAFPAFAGMAMTGVLICVIIISTPGYVFAATQVPVTAVVTVLPFGVYAPVITASDQTVREGEVLEQFEVLGSDENTGDIVHLEITAGQPSWLSIVSNTNGNPARMVLRAAPPIGSAGRYYKVSFKATDNSSYRLETTKDIYIIVNPANQPPVITVENQTIQAGQTLSFTVNCQDPDSGDTVTLTFSGTPDPNWLIPSQHSPVSGNPINVRFTGTPGTRDEGPYTMTFRAEDNGTPKQSASKEIRITVTTTNNPPVLDIIRDKEVPIRVKLEFAINATDPDGDQLTYSAQGAPFSIGAAFDSSTRKFRWTPTNSQVGSYPVRFEVSDGVLTDSEDIIVYVSPADAPVFDPFPYLGNPLFVNMYSASLKTGTTLYFSVTAKDPNNDPIRYGALNLPAGAIFNPSNQTFTWTPSLGQEGNYQITFTVSDGVYTTTKDLLITVQATTGPQLKPVGERYVRAGETLSFTLEATDPNTSPGRLIYSVSNNPAGSSLTGPNFTWTPTASQVGTYRDVIFTVSDGTSSDSSNCWIFVLPSGAPIIERIGEKHVVEMRTLRFTVNATDPDGDILTYLQPTNAPKGSYFDPQTRTFTWTPAIGERGIYNDIIFRVTDGINTVSDIVWIFVEANDAPIARHVPEQHIKAGQTLSFDVSAYDPDGDDLIYRALNLPSGATFENRTFRWTPRLEQVGVYNDILFEVTDGVYIVTVRTWIFVEEPGAPVMERVGEKYVTAGETLTFTVNASDPDGDTLTYSATNLPPGSTFDPLTRTFTWTPTLAQVGTYPRVLFHVTDGLYTDTEDCWIFVEGPGAPIIQVPGEQLVRAGSTLEFTIDSTDTDTPKSGLRYSGSNLPPGSTFLDRVFTWTPTAEQIGTYPDVKFTVSDGIYADSNVTWVFVTSLGAPEFTQDIKAEYGRVGEPLAFQIPPANDPDDSEEQLLYYGINLPEGATFVDRTFRWTPQTGQDGVYKDIRLEVKDADNNIDSDIFWIYINK